MNFIEVNDYIVSRFDSYWLDTPIEHSNTTIDKSAIDEWVRLTVIHDTPRQIDFHKASLRSGSINLQVFIKPEIGQGRANRLAAKAGDFLVRLSTGTLRMKPYDIVVLGNKATMGLTTTETPWFQINCIVDFTYID